MIKSFKAALDAQGEVGQVREIRLPLVWVDGLPSVAVHEVVVFEGGVRGLVIGLTRESVEVLLLSSESVRVGEQAAASGETLSVPVGEHLAGCAITPLGELVDGKTPAYAKASASRSEYRPVIEVRPKPIQARRKIRQSLLTGVSIVDLLLPIGRGQRQLIIGDSKTGKGSLAQTAMQTQAAGGTLVVYAAIGKRWSDIVQLQEFVHQSVASENVTLVVSWAHDPASSVWLTPYTAMTVAEWWVDAGRDVLLILDDLSAHAQFHREIALLGRRFPGRESYPGDTFYAHARLLERAGNFGGADTKRDVSLSCLAIAETVEGNITAHVISNLISITDGHMLLDAGLFREGVNPPVDVSLSVTRVGRQTQAKLAKQLHRELTGCLSRHTKAKQLSHFGAELSQDAKDALRLGDVLVAFLTQATGTAGVSVPFSVQVALAGMIWLGWLTEVPVSAIQAARQCFQDAYASDTRVRRKIDELAASADLPELKKNLDANKERLLTLCQVAQVKIERVKQR